MTQLEIVNLALSRLGDRKQLANLSGSDPVTLAIISTYPVARDVLLASFPWPFATPTVELLDAPESYPMWAYAYVHPASALRVVRVFNENTKEGLSEDFQVQATANASGKRILAKVNPAYCEYIVAITNDTVFPPLFADLFAWFLASELAIRSRPILNSIAPGEDLHEPAGQRHHPGRQGEVHHPAEIQPVCGGETLMIGPGHPIPPSFAAGELSPSVRSRVDLDKRDIGLELCKNFIVRPHGGAINRPGFEYYGETKDSSKRTRLIPFVFSMDASECYVLELGHEYIRFYTADGQVVDSSNFPLEVVTPYQEADLDRVRYIQSADVMYLTHPNYPILKLSRFGHADWRLEEFEFTGGPFQDINDDEDLTVSMRGFAQKAYPVSDYATGAWTTAPLYSKLDEEPYSDSDYISCDSLGAECQLTLGTLEEPTSRSGHVLKVRAKGNLTSTS
jgi:hypothetical protein